MNAHSSFPLHEQREPTLTFLGLRSPIERAAEVERLCGYAPMQRGWWQQDCRIKDAEELRRRLADKYVPHRLSNMMLTIRAIEQNARVGRICKWAMRRMKRADDAYAQGKLNLTPVRGDAA
jgi:hypothetical protein